MAKHKRKVLPKRVIRRRRVVRPRQVADKTFKPISKIELRRIQREWLRKFKVRHTRRPDGRYDVDGDVTDAPALNGRLPVCFNKVGGNFSCGEDLVTLEQIPRVVGGDLFLRTWKNKFTQASIRRVCKIEGRLIVEFCRYPG